MLTVVNSWMMILDVFSNLNNSMIFQWALCIKIRTEIAKPIFFPQFYFFGIFHGSSTILWVFFGGKDKVIDALYPGLTVQLQEMPPL